MVNSHLRADMVYYRSTTLDAMRTMSSMQSNKYTVFVPRWKMNKEVSDLASRKPIEVMYVVNRLYQVRGACFSLYRLVEEADGFGLRRINKSSRLAVVDGLREGAM
jgi:hypothetical protein